MEEMSRQILMLQIVSRKAILNRKNDVKTPDSLKTKLLFLLYKGHTLPPDLISELCINKSNLALLTKELELEGLIIKNRRKEDKRNITIMLTDKGQEVLFSSLEAIERYCKNAFGSDYEEANQKLSLALDILDLL